MRNERRRGLITASESDAEDRPRCTSKFSEEQIVHALRQAESGTPVVEICRKMEITETTFYRWTKRYVGLGVSEFRELKLLREENRKLKGLVADLTLDKQIVLESLTKKILGSAAKRAWVRWVVNAFDVSERRACRVTAVARSTMGYKACRPNQEPLRARSRALAAARVSYGYLRLYVLLRREGWRVNHIL